ncbi:ferrochelatase, partial [Candidatus Pelagibacter sp.]|nr:ferrochelatase [Candidatus Pelagibacter sp.]
MKSYFSSCSLNPVEGFSSNLPAGVLSSPILKLTKKQSEALEIKLNQTKTDNEYKCFIIMRCWNPRAKDVIKDVQLYGPDEVVLMPLYPQYSAATSGSSIREWKNVCKKNNYQVKTST